MNFLEKDIPEYIKVLLSGYLTNSLSNAEYEQLYNWLNQHDLNKDFFNKIKASWYLSDSISENNTEEYLENNWQSLKNIIKTAEKPSRKPDFVKRHLKPFIRIAAMGLILVAIGAGMAVFYLYKNSEFQFAETEISAPLGSKSRVKLPDGSFVWLNAGSTIKYNNSFNRNKKREVWLEGEGFFKVKSNKNKPFIVNAGVLDIVALGTTFNVKAYPSEKQLVTTLVDGEIRINGKKDKKDIALTMKPNQKVTIYKDQEEFNKKQNKSIIKSTVQEKDKEQAIINNEETLVIVDNDVNTVLYTSWKDKRWIIESQRFGDLVVLIERRYNVKINLLSSELNNYLFSGTIENETLEQVLQILKLTIPLSYKLEKGTVDINIDNNLKQKYNLAY